MNISTETLFDFLSEDEGLLIKETARIIESLAKHDHLPDFLLRAEARLAFIFLEIGKSKALWMGKMNAKYFIRRLDHSKSGIAYRKAGHPVSLVNQLADQDVVRQREDEIMAGMIYEFFKMQCEGITKNLISIAHRLNDLNMERNAASKMPY
jgi:hypothetical protein